MIPLADDTLTKTQKDLLVTLSGRKCAWRTHGGWRPKGSTTGFHLATADALIVRKLAMKAHGRGTLRLELTGAGEALAREIKYERQKRVSAGAA